MALSHSLEHLKAYLVERLLACRDAAILVYHILRHSLYLETVTACDMGSKSNVIKSEKRTDRKSVV